MHRRGFFSLLAGAALAPAALEKRKVTLTTHYDATPVIDVTALSSMLAHHREQIKADMRREYLG